VWRVTRDVPLVGLGVVCESAHPRTRTSDLRIMHFDVREQPAITGRDQEREGGAVFDITMAYSDSTLKRWLYNTSSRTWALQAEGDYLTACLTGVISLSPRDSNTSLVTTATDGHIALWNEIPTSHDQQSSSSSSTSSSLSWPHRRKLHQNAILASTTHTLHDGSTLLITASDDNGIAFSRLSSNPNSDPDVKALCSTLLIPRAHAAAATALATYSYRCRKSRSNFSSAAAAAATDADEQEDTFYLLSAGIDQRIKAWEVQVDTTTTGNGSSDGGGAESVKVRKVQNVYTSVADVSCMSLLRLNSNDDDGEDEDSVGVLVCGVGMDVWRM
jgi:hypothetical protein